MAYALVEQGTLKIGDFVVAGTTYAKIRNLETPNGKPILQALPSTPVGITGFKALPEFADEFTVVKDERTARHLSESAAVAGRASGSRLNSVSSSELLRIINRSHLLQELNIILKADVQGSLTSVIDSLKALDTDEVAISIVSASVGVINENDLHTAATSKAIIYGFNETTPTNIKRLASRDKVDIRLFNVIYELIDDVRAELSKLLVPKVVETELGTLLVKGIFKTTKAEVICGGEVTKGKLTVPSRARVIRGKEQLAEVEVTNLKKGPQDTREVFEGELCGLSFRSSSRVELQEGDRLEFFGRETVERHL
jgi:translation initiation factor IF-2